MIPHQRDTDQDTDAQNASDKQQDVSLWDDGEDERAQNAALQRLQKEERKKKFEQKKLAASESARGVLPEAQKQPLLTSADGSESANPDPNTVPNTAKNGKHANNEAVRSHARRVRKRRREKQMAAIMAAAAADATSENVQPQDGESPVQRVYQNSDVMQFTIREYPLMFVKVRQRGEEDVDSRSQEQREESYLLQDYLQQVYAMEHEILQTCDREVEEGNIEYKEMLLGMTKEKFDARTNQMRWRLGEGQGKAIYMIGLADNGIPKGLSREQMLQSLLALCEMARANKSDVVVMRVSGGHRGKVFKVMIRQNLQNVQFDINVLLLGDQGSGKTTLLAVLMNEADLDNGHGRCRNRLTKHYYQLQNPKTASINIHYLGFDSQGKVVNREIEQQGVFISGNTSLMDYSTKILTFIDIGGHKQAEKALMQGLCFVHLEYALLVINARLGVTRVTEDHMKYAEVFKLPLIIAVTGQDNVDGDALEECLLQIRLKLKKNYQSRIPILYRFPNDIQIFTNSVLDKEITPVFLISNVTGYGLKDFQAMLANLPISQMHINRDKHTEFFIHGTFPESEMQNLTNFDQIIFSGTVIKGQVRRGQDLLLGPDKKGNFYPVAVKNIQSKRSDVSLAPCGQICTICIETRPSARQWLEENPRSLRKGMVLVSVQANPKACHEFMAEIELFDDSGAVMLKPGYKPVVTTQTSRQATKIIVPADILHKKSAHHDHHHQQQNQQQQKQQQQQQSLQAGAGDDSDLLAAPIHLHRLKSRSQDTKKPRAGTAAKHDEQVQSIESRGGQVFSKNIYKKFAPPVAGNVKKRHKFSVDVDALTSTRAYASGSNSTKHASVPNTETPPKDALDEGAVLDDTRDQVIEDAQREGGAGANASSGSENASPVRKSLKQKVLEDVPTINLEPKKKYEIRLRFAHYPEYVNKGQTLIINDNLLKAHGHIKEIFY